MIEYILLVLAMHLAIFVHIPSLLILTVIILSGWFYRVRILFWFPIIVAGIVLPLLIVENVYRGSHLSPFYYDILFWGTMFYEIIIFLMPFLGLIFSKIKNKKIDKLFLFAFLINIGLLVVMYISNWHYYTYMP